MDRKKLLTRVLLLIFFIFIVNYLAGKFYWYSAIWYFDMLMHFLGGLWLGLAATWFLSQQESFFKPSFILKIIFIVFLVGASWELFEIVFYNYIAQNPFNVLDTISDLFFDLAGGIWAILYFFQRIMFNSGNTIQSK
jgi:hypothetical protein